MSILFTFFFIAAPCTGLYLVLRNQRIHKGGHEMLKKYHALYELLTQKGKIEALKVNGNLIMVKMKVEKQIHRFTFEELDERLVISWKMKDSAFGRATRQWSFNPSFPQERMYGEIRSHIRDFQIKQLRDKKIKAGNFSIPEFS